MARVTAYEASDSTLHRDRKDWIRHESNLLVAQKLRPVIENLLSGEDVATRQQSADDAHDFIVNGIGLNTLRELFAIQFKPGAEDGDGASAASASAVGAVAATAGAEAAAAVPAAAAEGGEADAQASPDI